MEKMFITEKVHAVLTWWLSSTNSVLLKSMGPSAFIAVDKISLNDKYLYVTMNYELWTIYNEI